MTGHEKINAECEHRMTVMETLLSNHIPHVEKRLGRMEKILIGILVAFATELLGLLFFLIKGRIAF